jgi:HEAT repeat protein
VDALGALLFDPDPEVLTAAARGLGAMPHAGGPAGARQAADPQKRARQHLVNAYWRVGPQGRAEIAAALQALGTSLREAVEAEARQLWDRNARALAAGSLSEREGAAEELGRSGRAEAVRRLLPLVDMESRPDPGLAAAAARGLGSAGDRSARPALEDLLLEGDARLGEAAAEALGALGDPAAAEALAEAGADGPTRLAAAAVDALAVLPQAPEVAVALCEIAVRALDPAVAARAARQARTREAACPERPLVNRITRRGPDAGAALAALGALGLRGQRLAPPAERALAILAAGGGDATLRAQAARALGEAGWTAAGAALLRRGQSLVQKLAESRQKWVPAAAPPTADGRPLPPEWVEDLDPGDVEELAAVALGLAQLRTDGAAAFLEPLAADPEDGVRAAAVQGLGLLGGETGPRRLAQALADPSLRVRVAASAVLPRFGAAAVPSLAGALERAAPAETEWRDALVRSLGETGSPDAVRPLAPLLGGREAPAAAAALGRIGAMEAAGPLRALLERTGSLGRLEATEALGQLGAAESGPTLAAEITSDRPEVRAAAVRALGKLRHEPSSPGLEALRSDYYGEVRRAAVEALARLPARAGARR